MLSLKSLWGTPSADLAQKFAREIQYCEQCAQLANSAHAQGLENAYRRSIAARRELLADLDELGKACSHIT